MADLKSDRFIFKKPVTRNESQIKPISSFTNEPSVFYNPRHDKLFCNRFQLIKRKGKN